MRKVSNTLSKFLLKCFRKLVAVKKNNVNFYLILEKVFLFGNIDVFNHYHYCFMLLLFVCLFSRLQFKSGYCIFFFIAVLYFHWLNDIFLFSHCLICCIVLRYKYKYIVSIFQLFSVNTIFSPYNLHQFTLIGRLYKDCLTHISKQNIYLLFSQNKKYDNVKNGNIRWYLEIYKLSGILYKKIKVIGVSFQKVNYYRNRFTVAGVTTTLLLSRHGF